MNTEIDNDPGDVPAPALDAPVPPAAPLASEAAPAGIPLPAWAPNVEVPVREPWMAPPADFDLYSSPALSPSSYELPPLSADGEISDEGLSEALGIRNTLWQAGFPAMEGSALMEAAVQAAQTTDLDMDDGALQLRARETEGELRSMLGDAEYESRRTSLNRLIAEMDAKSNGAFGAYLDDIAPILANPMVQFKLLAHASQLESRRRK